jgi:hypothetical protein
VCCFSARLLENIGITCSGMWSGDEIPIRRTNFTQLADEFAFEWRL